MAAVDKTKTNPVVTPDVPPVVPARTQQVHVPGAETPGPDTFRSGTSGALDRNFAPRPSAFWRPVDPASREVNIPGVGRMTVGEALVRLSPDEHPQFSDGSEESRAMMTLAMRAADTHA